MKNSIGSVVAIVLVSSVAVAAVAAGPAEREGGCKKIRAQIVDAISQQCHPPDDVCVTGNVTGSHGLDGTTYFIGDASAPGPSTAPGYISISGTLTYTTDRGTLTVRETGITDLHVSAGTGHGAAAQDILSGTGRFAGVTGRLELTQIPVNGHFVSDVVGELCFAD
ncbi:MAG TPA: hypothetical protein VNO21_17635 [Polyangiaceae bacterium]|nr:hypothetical protein [Polyangiaceae bacterium]